MLVAKNASEELKRQIQFITDGEVKEDRDFSLVEESADYYRFVPLNKNAEVAWYLLKQAMSDDRSN